MGIVTLGRVGVEVFIRGGGIDGVHQFSGLLLDLQGSVAGFPDRSGGVDTQIVMIRLTVRVVVVGQFAGIIGVTIDGIFVSRPVFKACPGKSGIPGIPQPGGGCGILAGICRRQGGGATLRVGRSSLLVQVIVGVGVSINLGGGAAGIGLCRPVPRLVGSRRIIRGFLRRHFKLWFRYLGSSGPGETSTCGRFRCRNSAARFGFRRGLYLDIVNNVTCGISSIGGVDISVGRGVGGVMQRPARPMGGLGCVGVVVELHVEYLGVDDFRLHYVCLDYARIITAGGVSSPEIPVCVRQFRPVTCGGGGFDFSWGNEREGVVFPRVAVFAFAFLVLVVVVYGSVVSHSAVFSVVGCWSG